MQIYMTVNGGTQFVQENTAQIKKWPRTTKETVHLHRRGLVTWYDRHGHAWHASRSDFFNMTKQ